MLFLVIIQNEVVNNQSKLQRNNRTTTPQQKNICCLQRQKPLLRVCWLSNFFFHRILTTFHNKTTKNSKLWHSNI